MNTLVVDMLQQKRLGCWKVLKKGVNKKEKCFLSSQTRWSWQNKAWILQYLCLCPFWGICFGSKCLPLPSTGITNTPSGRLLRVTTPTKKKKLRCLVGRFCCVGKTQSGMFLSMSSGVSMLRSDTFSLLHASIATIAEPSLPLLISSPQTLTAWWCRFMCILFRVWLLHLRNMCGALSDPLHKGQVAGPVVWLNLLVCLCVSYPSCT